MTQLKTAFEQVLTPNSPVVFYITQGLFESMQGVDAAVLADLHKEMPTHAAGLLTQTFENLALQHAGRTAEFTPDSLAETVVNSVPHVYDQKPLAIEALKNALTTMLPQETPISLSETRGGSLAMKGDKITLKGFTPQYGGCC